MGDCSVKCDILSFCGALGHRSETWLYRQLALLQTHRVHVVAYAHLNKDEYPYRPVTVLPPRRGFLRRLVAMIKRRAGLTTHLALSGRDRAILRYVACQESIRIVQAHFAPLGCMISDIARGLGKPFVVWLYGSDVFRARGAQLSRLQDLFKSRAVFCCTSNALRQEASRLGCPDEKLHVFYPGVDLPDAASIECRPPHEVARVVSVGRLVDCKAPLSLVSIARTMRDRGVRFFWDHYGEGELHGIVEQQIRLYGLGAVFRLRGEQPNARVRSALQDADVMIHPGSVAPDGGREALGVVLLEALAAGLPIVSNRIGGIPEVVQDGETGFLVELGDVEGMAAKAIRLIREPDLRRAMAAASYQRAKETFGTTKQFAKLDAFYDELLSPKGKATQSPGWASRGETSPETP